MEGMKAMKDSLIGNVACRMNFNEIACVMSHLKAMKYWLEQYDEELLMVMEDDCDISTANYWGFGWKDLVRELPYHWDVLQLAVINPAVLSMGFHSRFVNDYSSACYIFDDIMLKSLLRLIVLMFVLNLTKAQATSCG